MRDEGDLLLDGPHVRERQRFGAAAARPHPSPVDPPASTQITLAPTLAMASRILDEAPSPMAIVHITALTPMMTPSIVNAVRIMFRRKALGETRSNIAIRI
jgi:hypothetical protein